MPANYQLPPVDSLDLWPVLSGAAVESPHLELVMSSNALLDVTTGLKLVTGSQNPAGWSSVLFPNSTSAETDVTYAFDCAGGCLYNVTRDPGEHTDLAESMPEVLDAMVARLNALEAGFFQNGDTNVDACPPDYNKEGEDVACACWMGANHWGGFFGPYQDFEI
jgi:arylsulfatase I/J